MQVLESEHVVGLKDVFPQGLGFVLVFEFMVSDLGEMISNVETPINESHIKSYTLMLLRYQFAAEKISCFNLCILVYIISIFFKPIDYVESHAIDSITTNKIQ